MPNRRSRAYVLSAALAAASLLDAAAIAQTSAPNAPQGQPSQPSPEAGDRASRMGRDDGVRSGRMGRSGDDRGWRRAGEERGRMGRLSEQDRQALLSARIAAAKAALVLTPEQEKLWGPVEAAVRDAMKLRQDWRARIEKEGAAANPVERMKRMGEIASARGAALTRLADAAAPLYASLTDDQKRRLRLVRTMARGMGGGMMGMMGMMGGDGGGERWRRWRGESDRGEGMRGWRHHDRHGFRHRGDDDRRGRDDRRL